MKAPLAPTPLMRQYYQIKQKYPGTILLFRVGDFYETFGEDAIKMANVLGIALTKRSNGAASEVELAGFPYHALHTYLPKLVKAGLRVAICEQLEDPKKAKGKVVKRGVTEVITPGVTLDEKLLQTNQNNYLAAFLPLKKHHAAVAFLELSTADFFVYQGEQTIIEKLLYGLKPAEVLVPKNYFATFQQHYKKDFYITRLDNWLFDYEFALQNLKNQFGDNVEKVYPFLKEKSLAIVAGVLLHYLHANEYKDLPHLQHLYYLDDGNYLTLDRFTIRNLELFSPIHPEGKAFIDVIDATITPMGGRLLRKYLLFPLRKKEAIEERQQKIKSFVENPSQLEKVRKHLKGSVDLERLTARLATQKLLPYEANQLKATLERIVPIYETLKTLESYEAFFDVETAKKIVALIAYYLKPEAKSQFDGSIINEGIDKALDEYRRLRDHATEELEKIKEREKAATGIPSLKIGYNKVFGYYIEVPNTHRKKVPQHYERKQTLTQAERYITPELKAFEEKILTAEERISEIEQQLYKAFLEQLQGFIQDLQRFAQRIAQLDVFSALAKIAIERNYCLPKITYEEQLIIKQGRHPVIECFLPPESPYVPNDLYLDNKKQQIIILTGPNMAGKSAYLRQTALIVILAQMGSYVPASAATIGIIDKLFTRVGASDNLAAGESTFMVEMLETATILRNATDKSLILLDEIGRGTSTYDGVAIAWAIVEYLHNTPGKQAKTIFATHYHELAALEEQCKRVKNYHIAVKEEQGKVVFLRTLKRGHTEHSFGIQVAAMANLPKAVIQRAQQLLKRLERHTPNLTTEPVIQLQLFETEDPKWQTIKQKLLSLDLNRLTPIEALQLLYEWQQQLKS